MADEPPFENKLDLSINPYTGLPWQQEIEADDNEPSLFEDLAYAIPRGAAGAIESTLDMIPYVDLPTNLDLGESQTLPGQIVEGMASFLTGFFPAAGAVSGFARMGGKVGKIFSTVNNPIGKGIVAGAAADFAVYDGNDPRLSNLLLQIPGLEENGLLEFLAADEEDNEYLGRFKNVLEGMGLGLMTEGFLSLFRKMRSKNVAVKDGNVEEAAKLDQEIADTASDLHDGDFVDDLAETRVTEGGPKATEDTRLVGDDDPDIAGIQGMFDTDTPAGKDIAESISVLAGRGAAAEQLGPRIVDAVKSMELTEDKTVEFLGKLRVAQETKSNPYYALEGVVNLGMLSGQAHRQLADVFEDVFQGSSLISRTETDEVAGKKAMEWLQDFTGQDVGYYSDKLGRKMAAQAGGDATAVTAIRRRAIGYMQHIDNWHRDVLRMAEAVQAGKGFSVKAENKLWKVGDRATENGKVLYQLKTGAHKKLKGYDVATPRRKGQFNVFKGKIDAPELDISTTGDIRIVDGRQRIGQAAHEGRDIWVAVDPKEAKAMLEAGVLRQAGDSVEYTHEQLLGIFSQSLETGGELLSQFGRLRRESGRLLRGFQFNAASAAGGAIEDLIRNRGGHSHIKSMAQRFIDDSKMATAGKNLVAQNRHGRVWDLIHDVWYGHLLSGIRTITNNFIGAYGTGMFKGYEQKLGASMNVKRIKKKVKKLRAKGKGADKATRDAIAGDLMKVHRQHQKALSYMHQQTRFIRIMNEQTKDIARYVAKFGWRSDKEAPQALAAAKRAWDSRDSALTGGRGFFDVANESSRDGLSSSNVSEIIGKGKFMAGAKKSVDEGMLGTAIDGYAKLIHLPSRAIMGGDEIIKQMAYNAHVQSEIWGQGWEKGLRGAELDNFVSVESTKMFRDMQALTVDNLKAEANQKFPADQFPDEFVRQEQMDEFIRNQLADTEVTGRGQMAKRAVAVAKEITHQTDLAKGSDRLLVKAGASLQEFVNRTPMMRMFAPFIRTPVNLMTYGLDRTAMPGFNKDLIGMVKYLSGVAVGGRNLEKSKNQFIRRVLSNDPKEAAQALGQMRTTIGMATLFMSGAYLGVVTGRGPTDPNQRKLLADTGWQANSLRIPTGETSALYVEYRKLDPLAQIVSFYGNVADLLNHDAEMVGDDDVGRLVMGGVMAMLSMVQDKSYLQGLTDVAGLIDDPARYTERVIGGVLSSLATPAITANLRGIFDDHMNEANGILDQLWSRIPGLGNSVLDPKRNILGEPMDKKAFDAGMEVTDGVVNFFAPIQLNTTRNNHLNEVLAELHYPLSLPPTKRYGVDLLDIKNTKTNRSAYDRWLELSSNIPLGGRTLREQLDITIRSPHFKSLTNDPDVDLDLDSPRVRVIQRIVQRYRRAAERKLFDEFPEIRNQANTRIISRSLRRAGEDPSESSLLQ